MLGVGFNTGKENSILVLCKFADECGLTYTAAAVDDSKLKFIRIIKLVKLDFPTAFY